MNGGVLIFYGRRVGLYFSKLGKDLDWITSQRAGVRLDVLFFIR